MEAITKTYNLVKTWENAFTISLPTAKEKSLRLKDLESWDKCNGNETERQAKIKALNNLLF